LVTRSPAVISTSGLTRDFYLKGRTQASGAPFRLRAVDKVSLEINAAESVGLIGESGCGKTTLSRLLLQLTRPTAGSILFRGQDIAHFSKAERLDFRRSVQPVFQDPFASLSPRMRVGRIVSEPLRSTTSLRRPEIKARVDDVLRQVGLDPRDARRFPAEFSGGQRQRIAIARALVSEPQLIILDEAVSSQDVSIRAQILNLLQDIRKQREVAYLFITHDLSTLRVLCDRIYVMYLGCVVETGTAETVFREPRHPYTRALLNAWLPPDPARARNKKTIGKDVADIFNQPPGCRFHPRCDLVMPQCDQQVPALRELEPGQKVACHLYEQGITSKEKSR